jgi:hypothetical protein
VSTIEPDDAAASKKAGPSFGNMSADHWSRARAGTNAEALDYYRSRSQAPGVRAGGGARNFYCMRCDGVIPHDPPPTTCPHCGEPTEEAAKRYFNWVEINEPPRSDARAVLMPVAAVLLAVAVVGLVAWWFLR